MTELSNKDDLIPCSKCLHPTDYRWLAEYNGMNLCLLCSEELGYIKLADITRQAQLKLRERRFYDYRNTT